MNPSGGSIALEYAKYVISNFFWQEIWQTENKYSSHLPMLEPLFL